MRIAILSAMVLLLAACPPPVTSGGGGAPPPPPPPPPGDGDGDGDGDAKAPDGATCMEAADCDSGICEGEGCGDSGGVCAARSRVCTRDLQVYCGCDGNTFRSSGSCPGQRFASRGECPAGGNGGQRANLAVGAVCGAGSECASGICEGHGCGPNSGVCKDKKRMCTMDLRQYCGCDGKTFTGSGSCPNRLFAKRGACN